MTLVLAACLEECAIVCADRRVTLSARGMEVGSGQDDKLFVKGPFVVATYGNGPSYSVPAAIAQLDGSIVEVQDLNDQLHQRFDGTLGMRALIAYVQEGTPALLELDFEARVTVALNPEYRQVIARGDYAGEKYFISEAPEAAVAELLTLQRRCAAMNRFVGPPYDLALVDASGVVSIRRVDA